jgi:ribonuclease-3
LRRSEYGIGNWRLDDGSFLGDLVTMDIDYDRVEQILEYKFKDRGLLAEALTHASGAGDRLNSNERMEFLGDAILGFIVSEYLYQEFPTYQEGELTKIKSAVVSRKICAQVSNEIDLISMLHLGKGMSTHVALPHSIAAAVIESAIAAIYLDGGIEPARRFIVMLLDMHIRDIDRSTHQHNFKSVLQQYAQRHLPENPQYVLLDEKGPDHSKCFEVCVQLGGKRYGSSWANSKKEAEQKAALAALHELELVITDESGEVVMTDSGAFGQ